MEPQATIKTSDEGYYCQWDEVGAVVILRAYDKSVGRAIKWQTRRLWELNSTPIVRGRRLRVFVEYLSDRNGLAKRLSSRMKTNTYVMIQFLPCLNSVIAFRILACTLPLAEYQVRFLVVVLAD